MISKKILTRQVGLVFSENITTIKIWSPLANSVSIKFNDNVLALNKEALGYWALETCEIGLGDRYQFQIDDILIPDVYSLSQPNGVQGASEVFDTSIFKWTDSNWKNIALSDYIFYELHTGTFTSQGTFEGIISKLDYLVTLGITVIEIMPVAQFSGDRNWGYDGVFPFAVQSSYGGAAGLQKLVNACHEKGLAVTLDVVYNHIGPEGNYFQSLGPFFTEKYHTPWGNAINFDDEWSDGVREYFIENILMWFRDFHIDALRLDAVHAIKDLGVTHFLKQAKIAVDELMQQTGATHYLIAELDLNDPKYINAINEGGYGMDGQWIDEFHHALRVTAGGDKTGYYSDFDGLEHLAKSFSEAYVYDGIYSPHRKKIFGGKATSNAGSQFVVFSQNHDQVGNRMLGERSSQLFTFEMQKLMAGTVMCSPYLPMLFMGEEYGETNPFLYFVSHSDPDLINAVRKGRKEEFAAFHLEGEAPDPQSLNTFDQSKLQWELLKKEQHQIMLSYYQTLIVLRKNIPALCSGNRQNMEVHSVSDKNCLIIKRWAGASQVLCFFNYSSEIQTLEGFTLTGWTKIFDSAASEWSGISTLPDAWSEAESIHLSPQSLLIYSNNL
jgi:maltooligosyltrehalose trehalohydrolase